MFAFDQGGRRRHLLRHALPPRELEPWVEHLVVDPRPDLERGAWRIVPDASSHILASFTPGAGGRLGKLLRARVVGARSRFVDADVTQRGLTVGVRLRPGALAALAGAPALEVCDRGTPLPEIFGEGGVRAEEELDTSKNAGEALNALVGLLMRQSRRAHGPDWRVRAVERALADPRATLGSDPTVGGIADRFGVATRTLRQVSMDAVGFSPRRWLRIRRLFHALELVGPGEPRAWASIALRAGFHDASHLTREFQALLGETPTRWLARRAAPIRTRTSTERG
jgi:AraC-like DNA-binding protein